MKKSKRTKKTNYWRFKQNKDQYFKKSKILGFRSRASFKLIEINEKFQFLKKKYLSTRFRLISWGMVTSS